MSWSTQERRRTQYDTSFLLSEFYLDEPINPITGRYGFDEIGCYPHGSDALCKEIARALRHSDWSTIITENVMKSKGAKCLLSQLHPKQPRISCESGGRNQNS